MHTVQQQLATNEANQKENQQNRWKRGQTLVVWGRVLQYTLEMYNCALSCKTVKAAVLSCKQKKNAKNNKQMNGFTIRQNVGMNVGIDEETDIKLDRWMYVRIQRYGAVWWGKY